MSDGVDCVWPLAAELGEGPVWHGGALWFVDIKGRRIHRFDPAMRETRSWFTPSAPGFIAPLAGPSARSPSPLVGEGGLAEQGRMRGLSDPSGHSAQANGMTERDPSSGPSPRGHLLPQGEKGTQVSSGSAGSDWIVGLKTGLHRFDPEAGTFTLMAEVEAPELDNRINDGSVDGAGRVWFGTMHDPESAPSGALYRYDRRGLKRFDDGICITNGPAASPDGRTLYHTDTLARTIHAYDLAAKGDLSGKREFAMIEDGAGHPDGSTVDAEGCVWVALWGGWGVRRYSPAGEVVGFVKLPCANITKIAFGGEDLRTVYATSAWKGLSDAERADQPLAGGLFSFRVETPGQPQHEARLD